MGAILSYDLRPYGKFIFVLNMVLVSIAKTFASEDPGYSVYQYSVITGGRTAYCWIPPKAKQVRGVIISLSGLLERRWLEDPVIRKMAEREALAIIWIGPVVTGSEKATMLNANMEDGAGDALQKMLSDFSQESGYEEIAMAPLIPIAHSTAGPFAWSVAEWNPARVIAVIPVKTIPFPVALKFQGVPICYMTGERSEWPSNHVEDTLRKPGGQSDFWPVIRQSALLLRASNENNLVSVVTEPGGGPFDWSENQARFLALFISKACKYRLPVHMPIYGMVALKRINRVAGWLTDVGGIDPDEFAPAAYADYKGDPKKAYWFFDKEMAMAATIFNGDRKKREKQMLTFIQDGKPLPVESRGFVAPDFRPINASMHFKLENGFDTTLLSKPGVSGALLEHAGGNIKLRVLAGPAVQTGEASFKIQADRAGMNGAIWIQADLPGNQEYCRAVQAARINIPGRLTNGKAQQISFPIKQLHDYKTKRIPLHASSSSGLPVSYYVVAGPAYVWGNELRLTPIPVWSKFPVKITVVAYQWGSMTEPLHQSAAPMIALYYIRSTNTKVSHPVREQIIIDLLLNYLLQRR